MFCGPTGVGKTALCKTLSKTFFGTEDCRWEWHFFKQNYGKPQNLIPKSSGTSNGGCAPATMVTHFWEVNTYGTMYMIEHGVSSHFGMKTRVPSSLLCNQYHQRSTLRTCWFSCFCFWIFWTWSLILGDFFLVQLHQDTMIRLDMSEFMEKHTDPQPTGDVGIFGIVKPSNAKKNMGSSCLILNL